MMEFAKRHRYLYQLLGDQHTFMVVAGIIYQEHCQLDVCPKVIHIDETMSTNDEKCPLFNAKRKEWLGNFFTSIRGVFCKYKSVGIWMVLLLLCFHHLYNTKYCGVSIS